MRLLLIDDMREFGNQIPEPKFGDDCAHAYTYDSGIYELTFNGPWDILYLDHDLGETDPAKTGYGIMKWLEEKAQDEMTRKFFLPKKIVLVTSNPVGRVQMQTVIDRLYKSEF